jgi:hypothetical protein
LAKSALPDLLLSMVEPDAALVDDLFVLLEALSPPACAVAAKPAITARAINVLVFIVVVLLQKKGKPVSCNKRAGPAPCCPNAMKHSLAVALLAAPLAALAAEPLTDPYQPLIRQVQERLNQLGFDAGPVNGDFSEKTQAALAQFQLANVIPASGQLDPPTLAELGVPRPQAGG